MSQNLRLEMASFQASLRMTSIPAIGPITEATSQKRIDRADERPAKGNLEESVERRHNPLCRFRQPNPAEKSQLVGCSRADKHLQY